MSLGSTLARNIALDACYGSNASSEWPSTIYLHLFVSDPTQGGIELIQGTGSYAPVTITNNSTNFPAASGGQKTNGAQFAFATSTAAWSAPADYWWFSNSTAIILPPTTPSVTPAVAGATPWYYVVTSLNSQGESTASGVGVTTTGTATLTGVDYNTVAWTSVSGASTYNIYRSTTNLPGSFFLVDNTSGTSVNDTGFSAGTQTPPVSNTTTELLDGGPLSTPIIVPASGYQVVFQVGSIVIAT